MSDDLPYVLFDRRRMKYEDAVKIQSGNMSLYDMAEILARHLVHTGGAYMGHAAAIEYLMGLSISDVGRLLADFSEQAREIAANGV